ncbi:acyltransferase family protein [Smaragdicoccus niigatensis]|uniref:acyltransferase family protein n=1 Tax=Smaragdicoccus niigatensis TaxID=359359 RepID=UPI00035C267B|nr:acyltransferase [Smaragdicoccus niigatensis]
MAVSLAPPQTRRLPYLDNLRTALVACIIAAHGLTGYSAVGGWAYAEVAESRVHPVVELVLISLVGVSGLFIIGALFFISGLLAPISLARRGPDSYVSERLRRLGLPFLLSAFLVWPLSVWVAYRAAGHDVSPWWVFRHRDPFLDSGAMWFAEVLLVFSVGYAVLWSLHRPARTLLAARHLLIAVALIAALNFAVRLGFPARSKQPGDLHFWQLPQCLVMFGLGTVAGGFRWLDTLDPKLVARCRAVALGTTIALPIAALFAGIHDFARDSLPYLGGWTWQSLIASVIEGVVVVSYSIWLLGAAQRHLESDFLGRHQREAFAAFFLQGPVLMLLATSLRFLDVPAEFKAVAVAIGGVVGSFWIGGMLIRHTVLQRLF